MIDYLITSFVWYLRDEIYCKYYQLFKIHSKMNFTLTKIMCALTLICYIRAVPFKNKYDEIKDIIGGFKETSGFSHQRIVGGEDARYNFYSLPKIFLLRFLKPANGFSVLYNHIFIMLARINSHTKSVYKNGTSIIVVCICLHSRIPTSFVFSFQEVFSI